MHRRIVNNILEVQKERYVEAKTGSLDYRKRIANIFSNEFEMYDRKTEIVMELAKDSYGGMAFSDIVNKYNLIIHNRIIDEHKEREHIVSGYYKPLVSKDCDIKDINSIEAAIKSIKDEEKLLRIL